MTPLLIAAAGLLTAYALIYAVAWVKTRARRWKLRRAIKRGATPAWIGEILL